MYKNDRVTRRYSESFKLKNLVEFNTEKYTKNQLEKRYSIASTTINELIINYEVKLLINTRVR